MTIEIKHNGVAILDIGSDRVELEPIELEGYTTSLVKTPEYLFGFPYSFTLRRHGVVHIPLPLYEEFRAHAHGKLFTDPDFVAVMCREFVAVCALVESGYTDNEFNGSLSLDELWDVYLELMCFGYVNWLVSPDELIAGLARCTQLTTDQAGLLMQGLCCSTAVPYLLQAELARLDAAEQLLASDESGCYRYARSYGHWTDTCFGPAPEENAQSVIQQLREKYADTASIVSARNRLLGARESSLRRRDDFLLYLESLHYVSDTARRQAHAMARLAWFIATENEHRHRLQRNIIRTFYQEATRRGIAPGQTTGRALGFTKGVLF